MASHIINGRGISELFPSLGKSDYLTSDISNVAEESNAKWAAEIRKKLK